MRTSMSTTGLRAALVLCAGTSLLWATTALALPRVVEVRVGQHQGYTRVVFELDSPTTHSWQADETAAGSELVVNFDAGANTRVIASRSDLVESVTLRPGGGGSIARVHLRARDVAVEELVLSNPPRLVLDVRPAEPKPAPAPRMAEAPPTESAQPFGRPKEIPPPSEPVAAVPAKPADAGPNEVAPADEGVAAVEESEIEAQPIPTLPPELEGPLAEALKAAGQPVPVLPSVESAPPEAKRSPPAAPVAAPPASEAPKSGAPRSLLGLGLMLLGIAALGAIFVRMRARAASGARNDWVPPMEDELPEDQATLEPEESFESAVAAASKPQRVQPELPPPPAEPAPRFSATSTPGAEGTGVTPLSVAPPPREPEVTAEAEPEPQYVQELELRLERLEKRLAESLDARERLERQLAAHTEELRVQRAAIARTQRAVRAAVRPADVGDGRSPTPPPPPMGPGRGT